MKKIASTLLAALLMVAGASLTSCNGSGSKDAAKGKITQKTVAAPAPRSGEKPNYRYVDSDTLLAKYNLAKDYQEEMLRMQNNYDNTGRQRQASLQSLMQKYDSQMKNNQMDEAAYNKAMADIQNKQQAMQQELGKMEVNMQKQMMEAQKIVNDSIINYINEYNKDKGYDAIFMKAATLYISPDLDITDEIVKGLNARYNKK